VRRLNAAEPQFSGDTGAADPAVLAALAAYAAGRGSEHAALAALAGSRLLVPVVAVASEAEKDSAAEISSVSKDGNAPDVSDVSKGDKETSEENALQNDGPAGGLRGEKTTEMALPTLIGRDGRSAILAFTSLDALTRWRPDARPVAVPAARVWLAGAQEASAVVIDVAGPVPVTVEGARLAALAAGRPVPLPHQDPDVLAGLHAALGNEPLIAAASLTTPDQRAGWEHGPRPEDLPDLAGRGGADLAALGLDLPGPGDLDGDAAGPDGTGEASADEGGTGGNPAGPDTADLALTVTLAGGCDPAAATAAVRRVAEALLTATGGRLRRGMEISVAPRRAAR
jgi:SseB protein N-terminal domain